MILWILLALVGGCVAATTRQRPHIVMVVIDDMGWNDVSFHGSDQIPTPNIDALAYDGVILKNYYTQAICTPSRAALMTGKYPIHTGMQGLPMIPSEPRGLPAMKILPGYLKDLNYATHLVGKWHLGGHRFEYGPLARGFDSFFGYLSGFIGYYDYIMDVRGPNNSTRHGYDMRRNWKTDWRPLGNYATDIFTEEAVKIIKMHNTQKPLFLYLSHLAVHSGNDGRLLEAPQHVINRFSHISDPNRRVYAAMVSKVDESLGMVVEALHHRNMLKDSIIIFTTDNGAPTTGGYQNWGSNYPQRGIKLTLWEGGVHGPGFIWSPLIKVPSRVSTDLMHITDFLPTLISAAGGDGESLGDIDGCNQWDSITQGTPSQRKDILINIDDVLKTGAYLYGKYKIIVGTYNKGQLDGYYGASGKEDPYPPLTAEMIRNNKVGRILQHLGRVVSSQKISQLRAEATITCTKRTSDCYPTSEHEFCIFDLENDPCETTNITEKIPDIAKLLQEKITEFRSKMVADRSQPQNFLLSNPHCWNNTWTYWEECSQMEPTPDICNKTPC